MKDQERVAKIRQIEPIFCKETDGIYSWAKPQLAHSIGPVFPDAFDEMQKQIDNIKNVLIYHLYSIGSDEFQDLFDDDGKLLIRPMTDETGWLKYNLEKLRFLRESMPVWFSSGFGVEEYSADIDYWDKFDILKSRELLLLSVGIDPRKVDLQKMLDVGRKSNSTQPLVSFLEDRYKLLARKFNPLNVSEWSVTQEEFFKWANAVNFDVYEPFLKRLGQIYQPNKQKEEIDPREKTALLNVVAIMARDGYGYDPTKRSNLATELYEVAQRNNIPITKGTIRKHLKAASALLKDEWKHG